MGFSSGKSSAKRKAKKAAAAAYYKEFAKLQALPELEKISTSNKRQVEDALGNEASFRTRNLSQKADRLAREINNDEDYKKKVAAYNDRYAILKDQIANKSTVRYSISDNPAPVITQSTSSDYFGGAQNNIKNGAGDYAIFSPPAPTSSSFATKGSMFKTQEEAMADAAKGMEAYNNSLKGLLGSLKPRTTAIQGMGDYASPGKYEQKDIDAMRVSDPSRFIQEEKFNGFGVLYRNLDVAEAAANDINALGNSINGSKGNTTVNAYSELTNKLKPLLKKDAANPQVVASGGSVVSNELASANPYTETIAS